MIKTEEKLGYVVGVGRTLDVAMSEAMNKFNENVTQTFLKLEVITETEIYPFVRVVIIFTEKVQTDD